MLLLLPVGARSSGRTGDNNYGLASVPLAFTQNQGQWDEEILFRASAGNLTAWLAADGAYYQVWRRTEADDQGAPDVAGAPDDPVKRRPEPVETMLIKASFVGAAANTQVVGEDLMEQKSNYFLGNDPAGWRTDVANYASVVYRDIYPGIDLRYYGRDRQIEYDFVVSPGADPSRIRIQYDGAESVSVNEAGELVIKTAWGKLVERRPVVYQMEGGQRREVDTRYETLTGNSFGFSVAGDYDPSLPLVIDPALSYLPILDEYHIHFSTYLGGSADDQALGLAVNDFSGEVYVSGWTYSADFPTLNPYQTDQGELDAFVAKFDSDGKSLVYSTYLGGSDDDVSSSVAFDDLGCAYVTGYTYSIDFPWTPFVFQETFEGYCDAYVTRLNPAGNGLVYSSFLGGEDLDDGSFIAVDTVSNTAFVVGYTYSIYFRTYNAYQETLAGSADAFVARVDDWGQNVIYCTLLGGTDNDRGAGLSVDDAGVAFVTGSTWSDDFPTTGNAYQGTYGGNRDAFLTVVLPTGNSLYTSTYLGGAAEEHAYNIAHDESNTYVTGFTWSSDFPTVDPLQTFQGARDAFITVFNDDCTQLTWSTYLGGSGEDVSLGIDVEYGFIAVAGATKSADFYTHEPLQTYAGDWDVFVTRFNDLRGVDFSTYLGGSGEDIGYEVGLNAELRTYVTGITKSTDFPLEDPVQESLAGGGDMFLVWLEEGCCHIRGDFQDDADLDPLDAIAAVNWFWRGGPGPECLETMDIQGDDDVDPMDAVLLVLYFWQGGAPPVPCAGE